MKLKFFLLPITIFFTMLLGCNNLFYYPDSKTRVTPEKLKLQYDNITIKTDDNEELNGWFIYSKKKLPIATILHLHGNAENISTHFMYFSWLAENGFDLVEFDYRGYGKSTGEASRCGLIKDSIAALEWTRSHSRTADLFIAAQSLGGAVIIPAFAKGQIKDIQAIILDSTFASYRTVARQKLAGIWLTWPLQWPLSFLISDELSPIDYIQEVHIPLLFIHSLNDPVVPYESGKELFDAASQPKEFWEVAWEGHTSAFVNKDDRYRKSLLKYICMHLKKNNVACKNYIDESNGSLPYIKLLPDIKS